MLLSCTHLRNSCKKQTNAITWRSIQTSSWLIMGHAAFWSTKKESLFWQLITLSGQYSLLPIHKFGNSFYSSQYIQQPKYPATKISSNQNTQAADLRQKKWTDRVRRSAGDFLVTFPQSWLDWKLPSKVTFLNISFKVDFLKKILVNCPQSWLYWRISSKFTFL